MKTQHFHVSYTIKDVDWGDPFAKRFRWLDWRNINVRRAYYRWRWDRNAKRWTEIASRELADKIDRIIIAEVMAGRRL